MKKILICDDDADLRNIMRLRLSQEYLIGEAENGKQGLEFVDKEKPDLILLDIMMPEMDGLAMLTELRSRDNGKNIPVIMLTSVQFEDTRWETLMNLNAKSYIMKVDLNIEDLKSKIQDALK